MGGARALAASAGAGRRRREEGAVPAALHHLDDVALVPAEGAPQRHELQGQVETEEQRVVTADRVTHGAARRRREVAQRVLAQPRAGHADVDRGERAEVDRYAPGHLRAEAAHDVADPVGRQGADRLAVLGRRGALPGVHVDRQAQGVRPGGHLAECGEPVGFLPVRHPDPDQDRRSGEVAVGGRAEHGGQELEDLVAIAGQRGPGQIQDQAHRAGVTQGLGRADAVEIRAEDGWQLQRRSERRAPASPGDQVQGRDVGLGVGHVLQRALAHEVDHHRLDLSGGGDQRQRIEPGAREGVPAGVRGPFPRRLGLLVRPHQVPVKTARDRGLQVRVQLQLGQRFRPQGERALVVVAGTG